MSLTGHVQNGVVVFDVPNVLPDGTAVKVEAAGLPADASQNVDQYGPVLMPDISDGEFDRLVDELSDGLVLPRQADNLSRADFYPEHD